MVQWRDLFKQRPSELEFYSVWKDNKEVQKWLMALIQRHSSLQQAPILEEACRIWGPRSVFSKTIGLRIPSFHCKVGLNLPRLLWICQYDKPVPERHGLFQLCSTFKCIDPTHRLAYPLGQGRTIGYYKKEMSLHSLIDVAEASGGVISCQSKLWQALVAYRQATVLDWCI